MTNYVQAFALTIHTGTDAFKPRNAKPSGSDWQRRHLRRPAMTDSETVYDRYIACTRWPTT